MTTSSIDVTNTITTSTKEEAAKLRVFVVDDYEIVTDGLAQIIESAPEQDMELVGFHHDSSPALPRLVEESKANVVLTDLLFGPEQERRGLTGIQAMRRCFGAKLGIVAFTATANSTLRTLALEAGADTWLTKGATTERVRSTLRNCKNHDALVRLELFLDTREAVVAVSRNGTQTRVSKLALGREAFTLLYYLAEERSSLQAGWVTRMRADEHNVISYAFTNAEMWQAICKRYYSREVYRWDQWDISRAVSLLNKAVQDHLQRDDEIKLIIAPPPGRKSTDAVGSYYLNEFIEPTAVLFHGGRERTR